MALETTDGTFEQDVVNSDVPVLVDFWAPWCGPCRMLTPVLEELGKKVEGKAKVYKMNVDENPQTAQKFGITAIPTVILFKGGNAEQQLVGVQPEDAYMKALGV